MAFHRICFAVILCVSCLVWSRASTSAEERPNVVFILIDNTGWGDLSPYGGETPMPNLDTLASEGLKLTNYTVQAQCVPTRAAIQTARLPIRSGTSRVPAVRGSVYGLSPWEYTLGELFSDAGYQTALFGKWHLGNSEGRYPTDQGYDVWYGIANSSGEAGYTQFPLFAASGLPAPQVLRGEKGRLVEPVKPLDLEAKKYLDAEIAEKSVEYIRTTANSDKPFFLFVGFSHIHPPIVIHPDLESDDGEVSYEDLLTEIDLRTGEILAALSDAGIEDDTIVVFSSDNATAPYGGMTPGSNGPFRGHFFAQPYEGSYRVSAMVRWPDKIPAGSVSDEMLTAVDWLPTLAGLIGESERIPMDRPIDGVNAADHLLGKQASSGRDHVIFHGLDGGVMSVKWRHYKVVFRRMDERSSPIQKLAIPEIYNLEDDPSESSNLTFSALENAWVTAPIAEILMKFKVSERRYPNVKVGEDFQGYDGK